MSDCVSIRALICFEETRSIQLHINNEIIVVIIIITIIIISIIIKASEIKLS